MVASWLILAALSGPVPDLSVAPCADLSWRQAQEILWIRGERVILRPGVELQNAAVLVEDGVIVAIGPDVTKPEGAREIQGAVVCAGFVDPWSTLGLGGRSATELGSNAATRTVDGVDPWRLPELREEALRGGVTTARVQTGTSAAVGGLGAVLRTEMGPEPDILLEDACINATVGITRAGKQLDPFDRVNEAERLSTLLEKGRKYREDQVEYRHELEEWVQAMAEKRKELEDDFKKAKKKRDKEVEEAREEGKELKEKRYKEDKKPKKPRYDADSEAMGRAAGGEMPLVVEAHRAAEIRSLLAQTAAHDRLRLVLAGGTEATYLADELVERGVPVICWPVPMGAERKPEYTGHDLALAGELDRAGVEVLIGSGGGTAARDLRLLAALAVGHGLDSDAALHAITLGPARAFDVADRVGSLERGKDADVLVFDGDPLDTTSLLRVVVSGGRVVIEP